MLWPQKNSYKEFENEKKFLQLENPPPLTFLMVRPLIEGVRLIGGPLNIGFTALSLTYFVFFVISQSVVAYFGILGVWEDLK